MHTKHTKRWIALALTLVMALSLAVPAMGARPMMNDGQAVAEDPHPQGVGTMPSHSPAVADTPFVDEDDQAEALAAANPDWVHNFGTQGDTTAGIYSNFGGGIKSDAKYNLPYTYTREGMDIVINKGMEINSGADITFNAPEKGTMTLVFSTPNKNIKIDGDATAVSGNIHTYDVTAGVHHVTKKDTGTVIVYMEFMSSHTHAWTDWTETKKATCTEEGQRQRTCSAEGCEIGTETETIAKVPHTSVTVPAVPAGCVVPGATAGTKCSVCQTILSGCEVVPASGEHTFSGGTCTVCGMTQHTDHTWDTGTVTKQPTCTEAGEKVLHCTIENCGATKTETIAALNHDLKTVAEQAPTCNQPGWDAYQQCSRCDYNTKVVKPALGHVDDNNDGNCDRCGNPMGAPLEGAGGWLETMYVETSQFAANEVAEVSWTGAMNGSMGPGNKFGYDMDYLVRDMGGKTRIDIPGVRAGTYTLTVTTAGGAAYVAENIEVKAHDRSGYAHWNYTEGVGAYRDDGILKDEAIVLYVTEENKNTVALDAPDGTHVEGIGNILNSVGQESSENPGMCKRTSGGKVYWGIANDNQDVLKKLAERDVPLVVRIIGNVSNNTNGENPGKTPLDGVTAYDAWDYGGSVGDGGGMVRMKDCKNITIEGIGPDACMDGWGMHFMASSATPDYGKNFEVRNITFRNVPEDCIGMEGVQSGSALTAPILHGWVHNCSFYAPSIKSPAEGDKAGGDGACDFKRGEYFTMDYCYYEGYHKTNLVGSSDSSLQYNITWHHNYWKNCESRGPLGRQANMHIYNCIYEGQTSYAMNPRANCYIVSEYNAFIGCKNAMQIKQGAIKSYNDVFSGCIEALDGTIVDSMSTPVSSSNKNAGFELDRKLSYIPDMDYHLDRSIGAARQNVMANAGPMKDKVVDPEDVDTSVVKADRKPTAPVALPYDKDMNSTNTVANGTKDNIVFNLMKAADNTQATFGKDEIGQYIVFMTDKVTDITMTPGGSSLISLVNSDGQTVAENGTTAKNCPPGIYFIQPSAQSKGIYKEGKITHLKITEVAGASAHEHSYTTQGEVVKPATCSLQGIEKWVCSCGDFITKPIATADHADTSGDGYCDACGLEMSVITPEDPSKPKIPVASVEVTSAARLEMLQGDTSQITWSVLPADATNKSVAFSSSNPAVATVGNKGLVTAKTPGEATITIMGSDNKSDTVTVRVTGVIKEKYTFNAVDKGKLSADQLPAAAGTKVGDQDYFTVTGDKTVWRSKNKNTDLSAASLQIGAQESSGLTFTIPANYKAQDVTISFGSTGGSNCSAVALLDANGQPQLSLAGNFLGYIVGTTGGKVTFPDLPAGTYTIVCPKDVNPRDVGLEKWAGVPAGKDSDPSNPNDRGARITTVNVVQVTSTGETTYEPITAIRFEKTELALKVGDVYELKYTVEPASTSNETLTWVSSDPDVARVNKGTIRANKAGETIITARSVSNVVASCKVTVTLDPSQVVHITKLSIVGADEVAVDGVITMAADIQPENATCEVIWSVSDPTVAKINERGELTGIKDGVVTVIATTPHTDDARAEKVVIVGEGAEEKYLDGASYDLGYRYVPLTEKLTVNGMKDSDLVWAATYDANGRMTGVVQLTKTEASKTVAKKTGGHLRLFWVDNVHTVPQCNDEQVY